VATIVYRRVNYDHIILEEVQTSKMSELLYSPMKTLFLILIDGRRKDA